jgi:ferric-dicitrate binding protein FerR (iron transport regulator)
MNGPDRPHRHGADPDGAPVSEPGTTGASHDRIEALLRRTGARPPVPADRAARLKAAAKAQWHAEVRRETKRRWAWRGLATAAAIGGIGAIGAMAVSLGVMGGTRPDPKRSADAAPAAPAARVEMIADAAWLRTAGRETPAPLRPGDSLAVGAEVATEERGRVALRLTTGHSIRLDTGTRLRVLADRAIALDQGAVYVDSHTAPLDRGASDTGAPDAAAGSIEIHTPLGTIRDIGTQFEVRWLPASLRVRVREGRVTFDTSGAAVEVAAGQEVERRRDQAGMGQALVPRALPITGAGLDWIDGITPMPGIDGRSLQWFLAWMARERGLKLSFATPQAAAAAPRIVLNGSIAGMTLDQALASVLATCQMTHRIEGDVLRIELSSPERPGTP